MKYLNPEKWSYVWQDNNLLGGIHLTCICGYEFDDEDVEINEYLKCPKCGRKYYFEVGGISVKIDESELK